MTPIKIIEGKECERCKGKKSLLNYNYAECPYCDGKGKSPTTILFRIEEFKKRKIVRGLNSLNESEYILPKKGEIITFTQTKQVHSMIDIIGYKFKLTSDAVVKTVGEVQKEHFKGLKKINEYEKAIVSNKLKVD